MRTIDGLPLPDAILRAAKLAFIERGYELASMDEVAARAGTTKRTVYNHFGSKEELFRAAVALAVELFLAKLPPLDPSGEPATELETFAARFCELCTWTDAVGLQRVVMAEAARFPDLGRMLHEEVLERAESMVAEHLGRIADLRGVGTPAADGWVAPARRFLAAATGPQRFATLLGAQEPLPGPPGPQVSRHVDRAPIRAAVRTLLAEAAEDATGWRSSREVG